MVERQSSSRLVDRTSPRVRIEVDDLLSILNDLVEGGASIKGASTHSYKFASLPDMVKNKELLVGELEIDFDSIRVEILDAKFRMQSHLGPFEDRDKVVVIADRIEQKFRPYQRAFLRRANFFHAFFAVTGLWVLRQILDSWDLERLYVTIADAGFYLSAAVFIVALVAVNAYRRYSDSVFIKRKLNFFQRHAESIFVAVITALVVQAINALIYGTAFQ